MESGGIERVTWKNRSSFSFAPRKREWIECNEAVLSIGPVTSPPSRPFFNHFRSPASRQLPRRDEILAPLKSSLSLSVNCEPFSRNCNLLIARGEQKWWNRDNGRFRSYLSSSSSSFLKTKVEINFNRWFNLIVPICIETMKFQLKFGEFFLNFLLIGFLISCFRNIFYNYWVKKSSFEINNYNGIGRIRVKKLLSLSNSDNLNFCQFSREGSKVKN